MTRKQELDALKMVEIALAGLTMTVVVLLLTQLSRGDETPQSIAAARIEAAYQILFGDDDPPPPRTTAEIDDHAAEIIVAMQSGPGHLSTKLFTALFMSHTQLMNAEAIASQDGGLTESRAKLTNIEVRTDTLPETAKQTEEYEALFTELEILLAQHDWIDTQHDQQFLVLSNGWDEWEFAQFNWSEYYWTRGWEHMHAVYVSLTTSQAHGRNVAAGIKSFGVTYEICAGLLESLELIEDDI